MDNGVLYSSILAFPETRPYDPSKFGSTSTLKRYRCSRAGCQDVHENRLNLSSVTRACVQRLELESESHSRGRSRASSKSSSKSPTSATGHCARDVMKLVQKISCDRHEATEAWEKKRKSQGLESRMGLGDQVGDRLWGPDQKRRDATESRAEG